MLNLSWLMKNRMSETDIQRLRIIVDLAVRLRETIRRLTHMLQTKPHPEILMVWLLHES
jgi:hypothetical protein